MSELSHLPQNSGDARSRIIAAALELVLKEGKENFSLSDVCRAAGVSRTTLYRHFPDKEQIVSSLFSEIRKSFEKGLREAIAEKPKAEDRLEVIATYMHRYFHERRLDRLKSADPAFIMELIDKYFGRSQLFYEEVLAPYFDLAEAISDGRVDRSLVSYVLSNLLSAMIFTAQPMPYELDVLLRKVISAMTFRQTGSSPAAKEP